MHLEDLLTHDPQPRNPARPLVGMDEMFHTLVANKRPSEPGEVGKPAREDYTYENIAQRNLFIAYAPLEGWRRVEVTEHRRRSDWARFIRQLIERDFPQAEKIVLVLDNLNTHTLASLYEAFVPSVARRQMSRN